jgi:hypothetical protein
VLYKCLLSLDITYRRSTGVKAVEVAEDTMEMVLLRLAAYSMVLPILILRRLSPLGLVLALGEQLTSVLVTAARLLMSLAAVSAGTLESSPRMWEGSMVVVKGYAFDRSA